VGDEHKELIQKYAFSETVIKIIRSFVSLRSFDDIINESLKNLGEVCAAGRSYLFILKNNNTEMDNTHEWCAHGVEPQIENLNGIPADMVPWWMEKLNEGGLGIFIIKSLMDDVKINSGNGQGTSIIMIKNLREDA